MSSNLSNILFNYLILYLGKRNSFTKDIVETREVFLIRVRCTMFDINCAVAEDFYLQIYVLLNIVLSKFVQPNLLIETQRKFKYLLWI